MTATQAAVLPCTPDAVHGWLIAHDPDGLRRFDGEFRAALESTATTYDLGPVDDVIRRWWALIWGKAQHLSPEEAAQLERLDRDGDTAGLHRHDPHQ